MEKKNPSTDSSEKSEISKKSDESIIPIETAHTKLHNPKRSNLLSPWAWNDQQQVHTVIDAKDFGVVVDKLRSHCKEYEVLGFSCVKINGKGKTVLLQLSTHRGLCALFHLPKKIPNDLKALLEDANVLKVGIDASDTAIKLKSYKIITSRIFDLRYLAQTKPKDKLKDFAAHHLGIELKSNSGDEHTYAARTVRTIIELFKHFEEKERSSSITIDTRQAVRKFIQENCQPHMDKIYRFTHEDAPKYPKPRTVLPKPVIYIIGDVEKCRDITEKIQKHCQETKVLGLNCQFSKGIVTLLQLATYHGLCVLIQLYNIKKIPHELQDILNDTNILKVGMNISKDVVRLKGDFDINVVSTLDLRYLANECEKLDGHVDLNRLSETHLNVNIHPEDWRSKVTDWKSNFISEIEIEEMANNVLVTIELFKVFEKKLVEEKSYGGGEQFINEFCMPKASSSVTNQKWLTLPKQDICVVNTVKECKAVVKRLHKHSDEYNVVGFDCEWFPIGRHKVALLQLATHRGLCVLIRLCKLKTIPAELHKFLDDPSILKVGILPFDDATKLANDYRLNVSSVLDLEILAGKCKISARGLGGLSECVLHVKLDHKTHGRIAQKFHKKWEKDTLDEEHIQYAANDAHVSIELFKKFQDELMKENRSGDLTKDVQQFLEDHCEKYVKDT